MPPVCPTWSCADCWALLWDLVSRPVHFDLAETSLFRQVTGVWINEQFTQWNCTRVYLPTPLADKGGQQIVCVITRGRLSPC